MNAAKISVVFVFLAFALVLAGCSNKPVPPPNPPQNDVKVDVKQDNPVTEKPANVEPVKVPSDELNDIQKELAEMEKTIESENSSDLELVEIDESTFQ
jgi:PBP1b-binding outer membrane lipoprotein LpoB